MIEYMVLMALLAVAAMFTITDIGSRTDGIFSRVSSPGSNEIPGAPVPGPDFSLALGPATLEPTNRFADWSFDFSTLVTMTNPGSLTISDLDWSVGAPAMPPWMSLDQNGVASGVPLTEETVDFEIVVSHGAVEARRVYTLVVGAPLQPIIVQVAANNWGSCGLSDQGHVWCWGSGNQYGVLGRGFVAWPSSDPIAGLFFVTPSQRLPGLNVNAWRVVGPNREGFLTNVRSIGAGALGFCVVRDGAATGEVWCWGDASSGQLGTGGTSVGGASSTGVPQQVIRADGTALSSMTRVGGFENGTCASGWSPGTTDLRNQYCWGENSFGSLASGSSSTCTSGCPIVAHPRAVEFYDDMTTTRPAGPATYTGPRAFHSLHGGLDGMCATVPTDGATGDRYDQAGPFQVFCWGANSLGRTATGGSASSGVMRQRPGPIVQSCPDTSGGVARNCPIGYVSPASGVFDDVTAPFGRRMDSFRTGACMIGLDNTIWCWGDNPLGWGGSPSTSRFTLPVPAPAMGQWRDLATLSYGQCFLAEGSRLACRGTASFMSPLGLAASAALVEATAALPAGTFTRIDGGGPSTEVCVYDPSRRASVWCWGDRIGGPTQIFFNWDWPGQ